MDRARRLHVVISFLALLYELWSGLRCDLRLIRLPSVCVIVPVRIGVWILLEPRLLGHKCRCFVAGLVTVGDDPSLDRFLHGPCLWPREFDLLIFLLLLNLHALSQALHVEKVIHCHLLIDLQSYVFLQVLNKFRVPAWDDRPRLRLCTLESWYWSLRLCQSLESRFRKVLFQSRHRILLVVRHKDLLRLIWIEDAIVAVSPRKLWETKAHADIEGVLMSWLLLVDSVAR